MCTIICLWKTTCLKNKQNWNILKKCDFSMCRLKTLTAMSPRPPAFDTAAASSGVPVPVMPPMMMGCSIPENTIHPKKTNTPFVQFTTTKTCVYTKSCQLFQADYRMKTDERTKLARTLLQQLTEHFGDPCFNRHRSRLFIRFNI